MEIVKWYLDKITSQIPGILEKQSVREEIREHLEDHAQRLMTKGIPEEAAWRDAVYAMGDSGELAEQLGKIHKYDTSAAFAWTIGMLWVGMMVCFFQIGSEVMQLAEAWIGRVIMLIALFRLSELNSYVKKAFHCHAASCAAVFLIIATETLAWESAQNIGGGLLMMADTAFGIGMVYWLVNGVYHLAAEREQRYLDIWVLVEMIMGMIGIIAMIIVLLGGGSYQDRLVLSLGEWFGTIGMFLTFGLVGAAVFWSAAFILGSVRVKRSIQEDLHTGIGPFNKKKATPYLLAALAVGMVPFLTSVIMSFGVFQTSEYSQAAKTEPEAWMTVRALMDESLPYGREEEFAEYADWLGEILPGEEAVILQNAKWIRLFRLEHIQSSNGVTSFEEGRKTIVLAAELPMENDERIFHMGCLTVFESPDDGFSGISSFWLRGDQESFYVAGSYQPALLFYEKNGAMHRFEARLEQTTVGMMPQAPMSVVEYSLKRDADAVYCYQTIEMRKWNGEMDKEHGWLAFGCENAIQKLPLRIPYDTVQYDLALYEAGARKSDSKDDIVFRNGTVSYRSNMVWEKRGYQTGFEY